MAIRRTPSRWLVCFWSLIACGCAATGERFSGLRSPSDAEAQVVLYRPDLLRGSAASHTVYIDGYEVGVLRNAGWLISQVRPGTHSVTLDQRFESGTKKISMLIVVEPGKIVVLRTLPGAYHPGTVPFLPLGGYSEPWTMQQVTREIAEAEMKDLRHSR